MEAGQPRLRLWPDRGRRTNLLRGPGFILGCSRQPSGLHPAASNARDARSRWVAGTITNLNERVSRAGNAYYPMDLSDGRRAIHVFSFGTAPCRAGGATVEGTFSKVKRQGRYTFYNEVTASRVQCR